LGNPCAHAAPPSAAAASTSAASVSFEVSLAIKRARLSPIHHALARALALVGVIARIVGTRADGGA
jgi:hypothetical protein